MQAAVIAAPAPVKFRKAEAAIATLATAGVALSSFSLYHHFSKSKTSFCDLGQSFNCDLVNRSSYSTVFGVPVALIGILGYGCILVFATIYREKAETPLLLAAVSIAGLLFALRLTYLEAFVLRAWCILCLSSLAVIVAITIVSIANAARARRQRL